MAVLRRALLARSGSKLGHSRTFDMVSLVTGGGATPQRCILNLQMFQVLGLWLPARPPASDILITRLKYVASCTPLWPSCSSGRTSAFRSCRGSQARCMATCRELRRRARLCECQSPAWSTQKDGIRWRESLRPHCAPDLPPKSAVSPRTSLWSTSSWWSDSSLAGPAWVM